MRLRSTIETPIHWSKDFVEHLRTVHIGLIAVSAAIILLVMSAKPYNRVNALREIEEIMQLQRSWSPKWLLSTGDAHQITMGAAGPGNSGSFEVIPVPSAPRIEVPGVIHWKDKSGSACKFVFPERAWRYADLAADGSEPLDWSVERFPKSISEFKSWWNGLSQPHTIIFPTSIARNGYLNFQETGGDAKLEATDASLGPGTNNVDLRLFKHASSFPILEYVAVVPGNRSAEVRFPVAGGSAVDVSQVMLGKVFRTWQPGSFDYAFPDLARAASGWEDLELEDVKKFISDESAKGTEVFEAFGMKFPADQITFGGIVFLLSVQLYFLVHLIQLKDRLRADDPGWDVPWVGMYPGIAPRAILFVTIVIVPCLAVLLLDVHSALEVSRARKEQIFAVFIHGDIVTKLQLLGLSFSFMLTAILSILCWRNKPHLSDEIKSVPLFE